ncbi:hypothetical protein Mapa_010130 [Marchantia paleacea]|nr:hypothetical protein Mapa_010130 [Marchantia paleacea]
MESPKIFLTLGAAHHCCEVVSPSQYDKRMLVLTDRVGTRMSPTRTQAGRVHFDHRI